MQDFDERLGSWRKEFLLTTVLPRVFACVAELFTVAARNNAIDSLNGLASDSARAARVTGPRNVVPASSRAR